MPRYTAIARKRVTYQRPALNTAARPLLIDASGKELPKDDEGKYIGTGTQKMEVDRTDATENPVMDDAGNPIEAGTQAALIHAIKEHFKEEENTEILSLTILETTTVREISAEEYKKL